MKIPAGYQRVMPYLLLNDVEGFLKFTQKVFGAKEKMRHNREGSNEVMHAEITIGDSTIMMGQTSKDWGVQNAGLYIHVENADETFKQAISEGATEVMPVTDQSYGRSGGVTDPFGNTWWVTTTV
ncbi:putative glyoxalase superfamily protein PhnB [Chitinophaga niastensis]|uniref:Putative glyoxalase superfamily protein PhnB n=1 Tax=Chitinophaga niastensis TaxID=536980 RepID=A0A2P8HNV9_CHINA|nr:VOC family protein [Chitinophaga niastensis]PSL47902.1 putative glyoxalase superfamily protein PhnB [Chitinophaga niastensis]